MTGYVLAFNYCRVQEVKGRTLSLIDTGLVIMLATVFWLPLYMLKVYCDGMFYLYQIINERSKL